MAIKARLQVYDVKPGSLDAEGGVVSEMVTLTAVYSPDKESPNYSFSQATPSATMTMWISNKAAHGAFKVGKQYDVTFEELP